MEFHRFSAPWRCKDGENGAFAIQEVGRGTYLVAGYQRNSSTDPNAAQAYLLKSSPFAPLSTMNTTVPRDGSNPTGVASRAIAPSPKNDRFLLAGWASWRLDAGNQTHAFWQAVSGDLKRIDPPVVFSSQSAIFDLVTSSLGRTLAVGKINDDDGRQVGWTGFLGERQVVAGRRLPHTDLTDVATLPFADDAYQLPAAALTAGKGYSGRLMAAGYQINLAFSVSATTKYQG